VVLMGNGDGTFQNPVAYSTELAYSLAIADFNNDGNLDIVVANLDPSTVSVYLGNGDGTFQPPIASDTTYGSYYVVVGDFNNDGKPDVVVIDPPYGREPSNHSCNFLQITLFNYRCGSGPA
jgi:hypothetical protein